jgi:hypothetical protein
MYRKVRLACSKGMSQRAAARHFNITRDSVAKMLALSVPPGYRRNAALKRPKLDAFTGIIDGWLEGDPEVHRKQHQSAKRVLERIRAEHGFTGGYTTCGSANGAAARCSCRWHIRPVMPRPISAKRQSSSAASSRRRISSSWICHPSCRVAMEACPASQFWAREFTRAGHTVRMISPQYVTPDVKRQKNDAADAEAIVEAATRPNMRFVEPKTAEQQARAVVFRVRQKLVAQRIELINALRSHLYPKIADHRGHGRHGRGLQAGRARGHMARQTDAQETPHPCRHRTCQQDGAPDLGDADEETELPGSGFGGGVTMKRTQH